MGTTDPDNGVCEVEVTSRNREVTGEKRNTVAPYDAAERGSLLELDVVEGGIACIELVVACSRSS